MLEQVRIQAWWTGCAHAFLVIFGTVVLFFGAFFFALCALYLAAGQGGLAAVWLPALGSVLCLAGGVLLVRHLRNRKRTGELLLEVKRLELRVLELEAAQRGRDEKSA